MESGKDTFENARTTAYGTLLKFAPPLKEIPL